MPQRLFLAQPRWLLLRNMRLPPSSWQFANNEPCAAGAPLRMKMIDPPLISGEARWLCEPEKRVKMG
jgi:hypothetical protein